MEGPFTQRDPSLFADTQTARDQVTAHVNRNNGE